MSMKNKKLTGEMKFHSAVHAPVMIQYDFFCCFDVLPEKENFKSVAFIMHVAMTL